MTRIACLITMNEPARPALLRVALAHSPRVEDAGAGRVYLDASGLEGLFGDAPRLACASEALAYIAFDTLRELRPCAQLPLEQFFYFVGHRCIRA